MKRFEELCQEILSEEYLEFVKTNGRGIVTNVPFVKREEYKPITRQDILKVRDLMFRSIY